MGGCWSSRSHPRGGRASLDDGSQITGGRSRSRCRLGGVMRPVFARVTVVVLALLFARAEVARAAPDGTLTWGVHVTLAARWLDPSDTEAFITPFMVLYALHDALVKPMPAGDNTPSLAESWAASKDGLSYEFVLRKGVKFHNGDPVTAEDVKFSFDRYHGAAAKLLKDRVREVQIVDPGRVRFHLREPWPDFMTFYGTSATGAAWIVPKRYVEKVGDDGFKKAPVGAGPYRVVSFTPGVGSGHGGFRGLLAQDPRRQAAGVPQHARRDHARRRPQGGRRGHRLSPERAGGRGDPAHAGATPGRRHASRRRLPRPAGAVGPEVPVARPSRAAGGQPCPRP